jgi:tellurite resistance protein TehA-like permease
LFKHEFDLLVYLALIGLLVVTAVAAFVLVRIPENVDFETRKIRFAAATFTGIMMLLMFTATLYFVDGTGPGKEIFDKMLGAFTPLAGALVGYLFSVKGAGRKDSGGQPE